MKGVTQATYNGWRSRQGLPAQSVKNISQSEIEAIYKRDYWDAIKGDQLPSGVDYAAFDLAVNSGVSRSSRMLQECVGVQVDGSIGPKTLAAVSSAEAYLVIEKLCDARLRFLKSLKTWPTFGKGWSTRVSDVRLKARRMAK